MDADVQRYRLDDRIAWSEPVAIGFLLCFAVFLAAWTWRSLPAQTQALVSLYLRSTGFANGAAIPRKYTCDGGDVSPGLQWTTAPPRTRSLALVMHDPDAPIDFTHWLAYNIPAGERELAEGASAHGGMPLGSAEGINGFSHLGYGGPCPPPGKPHHYIFRIYALDVRLDLPAGTDRQELESAIDHHVLAAGDLIGLYWRSGE